MSRTLEQLFAIHTTQSNPAQITAEERKLIEAFELQPVRNPLQVVGRGAVECDGFSTDFAKDIHSVTGKYVDSQQPFKFWYKF